MESKNIIIYVAGQRFSIRTVDSEEYVISTGEQVDLRIKGIQNDNPRLNRDACAVLAALDYCDDMRKLASRVDVLRDQVKDYLADSERLRTENSSLTSEVQRLTEELKALKEKESHKSREAEQKNAKGKKAFKNGYKTDNDIPYADTRGKRYGVQSFSGVKESVADSGLKNRQEEDSSQDFHQFSIFDEELSNLP